MANYGTLTSDKNKDTAFWLCLFGGWFGLHLFYVGKIGKGILYLFTMGLFFVGWFGDLIKIGLGSFRDNTGAPLRAKKKDNQPRATVANETVVKETTVINNNPEINVAEQLEKLAKLKEQGVLTEEEFNAQKSQLLNK